MQSQLKAFLKVFQESFQSEIKDTFQELLDKIIKEIDQWTESSIKNIPKVSSVTLAKDLFVKTPEIFKQDEYMNFKQYKFDDNQLLLGNHPTIKEDEIEKQKEEVQKEGTIEIQKQLQKENEQQEHNDYDSIQKINELNNVPPNMGGSADDHPKEPLEIGFLVTKDQIHGGTNDVNVGQSKIDPETLKENEKRVELKNLQLHYIKNPTYGDEYANEDQMLNSDLHVEKSRY